MIGVKVFLTVFFLSILDITSFATWSIIVVDPKTKEIGIAGASCTKSVYGIGAIIPGKGAIVVQAMSNFFARKKGWEMIMEGKSATEILNAIKDPQYQPDVQQYGIVCMNDLVHPQTFTGKGCTLYNGSITGYGISVQGNTLTSDDELEAVFNAALAAQKDSLPLQDILMLALEAGSKSGGDKRCGELKAWSAFVTVAKPNDDAMKPWLNLVVYGTDEKVNAVESLRKKFDEWGKKQKNN
jgi:uncharacterized Ntn-hydrolase superfamily protein